MDESPLTGSYASLAGALCGAWRVALHDDRVLGIEADGEEIFDGDELREIFAELEKMEAEELEGGCLMWARRIIGRREDKKKGRLVAALVNLPGTRPD